MIDIKEIMDQATEMDETFNKIQKLHTDIGINSEYIIERIDIDKCQLIHKDTGGIREKLRITQLLEDMEYTEKLLKYNEEYRDMYEFNKKTSLELNEETSNKVYEFLKKKGLVKEEFVKHRRIIDISYDSMTTIIDDLENKVYKIGNMQNISKRNKRKLNEIVQIIPEIKDYIAFSTNRDSENYKRLEFLQHKCLKFSNKIEEE